MRRPPCESPAPDRPPPGVFRFQRRSARSRVAGALAEPIPAEPGRPTLLVLVLILPGAATDGIVPMCTLPPPTELPVRFVSAYGRSQTIARPLQAGAGEQIVEPYSPAELEAPLGGAPDRHVVPGPFLLADLAINRAILRVAEQD